MVLSLLKRVTIRRAGQALFNGLVTKLPSIFFNSLKLAMLRRLGSEIGTGVRLGPGVRVLGPQRLRLEDHVSVAHSVVLDARGGLVLRMGTLIGFESVLLTYTHESGDPTRPVHWQGVVQAPSEIGECVWVGARCLLLPGTTIGESTIVGAMSVVSRNLDSHVVATGAPARKLRDRKGLTESATGRSRTAARTGP